VCGRTGLCTTFSILTRLLPVAPVVPPCLAAVAAAPTAVSYAIHTGRALLSHKKGSTRTEPRQNEHSVEAATVATAGGEDWADLSDTADDTTAAGRRLAAAGGWGRAAGAGAEPPHPWWCA
jgi:hypothetical protein